MNIDKLRLSVHELLKGHETGPLRPQEIAARLRLHGAEKKALQKVLNVLVVSGAIVRIRGDRYGIGTPADLVTGTISVARSGNGFVTPAGGGSDVFVLQKDMDTALPGDRVVVRLFPVSETDGDRMRSGKVIELLDRARREIVGTLRSTGRFHCVVPLDASYKKDFYVADTRGARINDRVVMRVTRWDDRQVNPEADIVEVIGPADNPSLDTLAIMRHYGLKDVFPAAVLREAEVVSGMVNEPGDREDIRGKLVITIDPERARDFDDALSLERDGQGRRILGVHIADVCHFVRPNSALDREASKRGNSVYLPDRVLPMLPEQLSNGVCSLRPDEDRLAFSAFLTLDASGQVVGRRFAKTLMRSRLRLTYEQAYAVIEPGSSPAPVIDGAITKLLNDLDDLAQQLRSRRFMQNALDLDVPEYEVKMGQDGMIESIHVVPNDRSHQLVEECMVAANEAVAAELHNRGVPVISRIHEAPDEDKLEDLAVQLAGMGLKPGNLQHRKNLAAVLKSAENHPLRHQVKVAVLRSMKRAVYGAEAKGHFGLAKRFYAHFTSPIRRYPDLLLHRQLAAMLMRERAPYSAKQLGVSGESCTKTEWIADEAERAIVEIKKYRYLEQEIKRKRPHVWDAVVVTVTNFGMFVEITDLQLQGLVHMSAISDKFVEYNERQKKLRAGREVYGFGRKVKVVVAAVDFDKRRIDLALV